uniref:Protein CutA homolog n=1 Tax=Stegastes partitus TaxID=144197 RepID=A0A3B5APN8_9TELE
GMTFVAANRMEWLFQRCHKEAVLNSVFRSFLVLTVSMYPVLWSVGVQLHSVFTGSYVPGHHSVLLINSPNEQAAKDIGSAVQMYYWKGEIQDASEILMLVKTKTSRIQQVIDYVRSVHPYANPEVLSFPVEDGSLAYMKWMDEAIPDD